MSTDPLQGWTDFYAAEAGASAALTGLLFVSVSINLGNILKYRHLPTRALEALLSLVCVLFVATFALVPGQSSHAVGVEIGTTGLMVWLVQSVGLYRTHGSGYETVVRYLFNQLPPLPFIVAGVLLVTGNASGPYWVVPGTLLCFLGGLYGAWVLLVEILR